MGLCTELVVFKKINYLKINIRRKIKKNKIVNWSYSKTEIRRISTVTKKSIRKLISKKKYRTTKVNIKDGNGKKNQIIVSTKIKSLNW